MVKKRHLPKFNKIFFQDLITVKLHIYRIVLPVVMRESVSALNAGANDTETGALSTYAFLYGTIPTAPAVFVFSNLYQLEIDLVRILITFSAPGNQTFQPSILPIIAET